MVADGEARNLCAACGLELSRGGGISGLCPGCLLDPVDHDGDDDAAAGPVTGGGGSRMERRRRAPGEGLPTRIKNYELVREVEGGGMGIVYLARHTTLKKQVAIKILRRELVTSPSVVARFFTEARTTANIGNEHIIDVSDFDHLDDGTPYFIMEWLDGTSLAKLIRNEGRLPEARVLRIVEGIADAIGAAHARGIVHRDLKPDNVFLVNRGGNPDFVKVLDFGIAKLTNDDTVLRKTREGAVLGTPLYMAPEQCRGRQSEIDHRTDVYALGVMVYEMLTGSVPFDEGGLEAILASHLFEAPMPPSQRAPGVDPRLDAVLLKALEKDVRHRHGSVAEFVAELRAPGAMPETPRLVERTGPAPVVVEATHAPPPAPGRRRIARLVALASVVATGGAVALALSWHPNSAATTRPAADAPALPGPPRPHPIEIAPSVPLEARSDKAPAPAPAAPIPSPAAPRLLEPKSAPPAHFGPKSPAPKNALQKPARDTYKHHESPKPGAHEIAAPPDPDGPKPFE